MTEHRIDILISRIVDKAESADEWTEFRSIAATEPSAWELLAEAQRDNERLIELAHEATAIADRVDLPHAATSPLYLFRRRAFEGAGWVAAAAIILAWIATGRVGLTSPSSRNTQTAGATLGSDPVLSADDAFSRYIDKGQADGIVVGEVDPKILLATSVLPAGGYEVVFVRQVIERRAVPTLVQFRGTDENGKAHAKVVRPTMRDSM